MIKSCSFGELQQEIVMFAKKVHASESHFLYDGRTARGRSTVCNKWPLNRWQTEAVGKLPGQSGTENRTPSCRQQQQQWHGQ